jgi:hypothetical protein
MIFIIYHHLSTIAYFYLASLLLYNATMTFVDSYHGALEFRNLGFVRYQTTYPRREKVTTVFEAAKWSAAEHFAQRLADSVVWPVKLITNTIPFFVTMIVGEEEREQDQQKVK